MIRFNEVSFRYATADSPSLTKVSFELEEGELCLVLGPTGSGKSTLLGCVNSLVPRFTGGIRTGSIWIDGADTTLLAPRELANIVGYVGQDPLAGFVTDTVEEELAYAMEQLGYPQEQMRRRVEETLDLLGIAELRGRSLRTLSGGQQQRVAIGSVLTANPKVLVLDEPTSALDPVAAEEVLALLSRLVRDLGTTVLVAEHRMERVIEFADTALLVKGSGEIVHGAVAEVLKNAPIRPPLVELASVLDWQPMPLSIRAGRRFAAIDRSSWLADPPALPDPPQSEEIILRAVGIVVRYPGILAVRDVDFELYRKQVTALMGRNGCGKSSLLWALHGAGERSGGTVESEVRISLVPQNATDLLYLSSVRAECAASDAANDKESGTTAALLHRFAPTVKLDAHPRDLSEGQKLAVVLAIELIRDPEIIFLDEPTRGLDYSAKRALSEHIAELASEGKCVVLATHDVEMVAETCDRVIVMAEGEVISDGPTRTVLAASQLFGTQVSKVANPVPLLTVEEYCDARR